MQRAFRTQKRKGHAVAWAAQHKKEVEKAVVAIGKPPNDAARDAMLAAIQGALDKKRKLKTTEEKELLKRVRKALVSAKKAFLAPMIAQDDVEWKAKIKPETDRRRKQSAKQAAKTRKKAQVGDKDHEFAREHAHKFAQLLADMELAFGKDQRKTGRAHVPNRKYGD